MCLTIFSDSDFLALGATECSASTLAVSAGSFELSVLDAARKYSDFFALSATECSVSTLKTTMPSSLDLEAARRVLSTIPFRNPLRIMKSLQKCPLCLLSVQILPFAASSLHFCLFLALSGFHQRFVFLHTLERASQSICWHFVLV